MQDRVRTLAEVASDVLQRIVREMLSRKPGGHLVRPDLRGLELRLPMELDGTRGGEQRLPARLIESIDELLEDAVQRAAAFRPGTAFCHRCHAAGCEHSSPPSPRHVLTGYAPTGAPRWTDFAQLCLERKHPQVDRLYENPPAFLTLVQERRELHAELVRAFRHRSYALLGQVTAGFYPVRSRAEEGRGVLALTLQAVSWRTRRGDLRLGLNPLGRGPAGEDLELLWERFEELPWRKAVTWAQKALQGLTPPGRRPSRGRRARMSAELEQRVNGILRGLARRLERDQRARSRRTRHAEERHAAGDRPTRKAMDDARAANGDSILVDTRSDAVVVLGDRGRTHFFTREGQHVSSVRYSKDAVARKVKIEQWRPASAEEREELRKTLAGETTG